MQPTADVDVEPRRHQAPENESSSIRTCQTSRDNGEGLQVPGGGAGGGEKRFLLGVTTFFW